MSRNNVSKMLKEIEMDASLFDDVTYKQIFPGHFSNRQISGESKNFYITKYNLLDDITLKKFTYQRSILSKLQSKKYFPDNVHCFYDAIHAYVISSTPSNLRTLNSAFEEMSLAQFKTYFSNLLKIFKEFDSFDGVFIIIYLDYCLAVSPKDITQPIITYFDGFYKANEDFYIDTFDRYVRSNVYRKRFPIKRDRISSYVQLPAKKIWNLYAYIYILSLYWEEYKNMHKTAINLPQAFETQLDSYSLKISHSENFEISWKEVQNLIDMIDG